jgi:hypothetical protein
MCLILCVQSVVDDEPLIGRFKSVFNLWKKKDSENGRVQKSQPSVAGDRAGMDLRTDPCQHHPIKLLPSWASCMSKTTCQQAEAQMHWSAFISI